MIYKHGIKLISQVLPFVGIVLVAKVIVHFLGFEIITLNAIFSALIGANVFLIGFLISGVMADYKESEKIPGEIEAILLSIVDEINFTGLKMSDKKFIKDRLDKIYDLSVLIKSWFHKDRKTRELMTQIEKLTDEFVLLEQHTAPNYIARLKQEQNSLRKIIIRVHTIRETDFIFSGYFIANTTTLLLLTGMIFLKIEPFYESLFFVGIVAYLLLFLLRLIKDLDNPFGYYEKESFNDVSIHPIEDAIAKIQEKIENIQIA
jgi:predicted membrane chloride channel (bestrophin family)